MKGIVIRVSIFRFFEPMERRSENFEMELKCFSNERKVELSNESSRNLESRDQIE